MTVRGLVAPTGVAVCVRRSSNRWDDSYWSSQTCGVLIPNSWSFSTVRPMLWDIANNDSGLSVRVPSQYTRSWYGVLFAVSRRPVNLAAVWGYQDVVFQQDQSKVSWASEVAKFSIWLQVCSAPDHQGVIVHHSSSNKKRVKRKWN